MEDIFSVLFDEVVDIDTYKDSLERNFQTIQDFYNLPYQTQQQHKDEIDKFILLKNRIICSYEYDSIESRSFVLILLELCERFALLGSVPRIMRIIQRNGIQVNKRMSAALKYLFPSPSSNGELVEKFDEICNTLDIAIEEEDDDSSKALVTFLNYYAYIISNTNEYYATLAKQKLCTAIDDGQYSWLYDVEDISQLDVINIDYSFKLIENKIDSISSKLSDNGNTQNEDDLLIEEGTEYSEELTCVPNNFLSIRDICVNHSKGVLNGRGVMLLNTEDEMYEYIKRYGKMHYAKLLSSFESTFPQSFNSPIRIFDWGCGQGLATMAFLEKYGCDNVKEIFLIEPSEIVLRRAALHCRKFAPNCQIHTICKTLDDVNKNDLKLMSNVTSIHLFSNILDIDSYNISHLLTLLDSILDKSNYFICVSPYIDDIKSARLISFMNHFKNYPTFKKYHDVENTKSGAFWMCNNSFQNKNFSHGYKLSCKNYDSMGCSNKWTRVLKVFSV